MPVYDQIYRNDKIITHIQRLGSVPSRSASTGVPCPESVKQDGLSVARYLRSEKRAAKLLVHGESIGGLVASYVASACQVDLLVCDRTFASLDATAARLMGQWASLGLRYLAMYHTDVVSDYLRRLGLGLGLESFRITSAGWGWGWG